MWRSFAKSGNLVYFSNADSKNFHHFESWTYGDVNKDKDPAEVTQATRVFTQMSVILLKSLLLISGGFNEISGGSMHELTPSGQSFDDSHKGPCLKHSTRISNAFFESMYSLLDGYLWLVAYWSSAEPFISDKENNGWIPYSANKPLKSYPTEKSQTSALFVPREVATGFEYAKEKAHSVWKKVRLFDSGHQVIDYNGKHSISKIYNGSKTDQLL